MKDYRKYPIEFSVHSGGSSARGAKLCSEKTLDKAYKLIYVFGGVCRINIDGKYYRAEKGDSVLVFPFCSFEISHTEDLKYAWLEFSGFAAAAVMGRISFSKNSPVIGPIDIENFEKMYEMPEDSGEAYSLYRLGGCVLLLMSYYIELFPSKATENENHLFDACRFIEAHFHEQGFCVTDVVNELKIDRTYLFRLFKNKIGVSIMDYITGCRISQAEILLGNKDLSVKDIAYSVGFSDQMYFSRVFKRINGRTPTQFRENLFRENQALVLR